MEEVGMREEEKQDHYEAQMMWRLVKNRQKKEEQIHLLHPL